MACVINKSNRKINIFLILTVLVRCLVIPIIFNLFAISYFYKEIINILSILATTFVFIIAFNGQKKEKKFSKITFKEFFCSYSIYIFLVIIVAFLEKLIPSKESVNITTEYTIYSKLISLFYIVILTPLCEEFIFRKAILDNFEDNNSNSKIIYSALCFAAYHLNNISLSCFIVGLFYGYIYSKTKRLHITIILHSIHNLYSNVFGDLLKFNVLFIYIIGAILFLVLIVGFINFIKSIIKIIKNKKHLYISKSNFLNIYTILYLLVCVISKLLYNFVF